MSTFTWLGGTGRYDAPKNWDPRGVPGSGDLATVASGKVVASSEDIQATMQLGSTTETTAPVLDLHKSSVGGITMPANLPQYPYNSPPPEYATVNVYGQSSIGDIAIGAYAGIVRAPEPYGHGPLTAPDNLTVNLVGRSSLTVGFDVKDGSNLSITGNDKSSVIATNSTLEAGNAVIDAPLAGNATIDMAGGALISESGEVDTGSLELGSRVGAGDTIDVQMGYLQIDDAPQFHGQIDMPVTQTTGPEYQFGPQSALLEGVVATSYSFDDMTHVLSLYNGNSVVDQLRFTPDITAASFGPDAHIDVAQTSAGVFLRGEFSHLPPGATELPVHVA
jgi:hypothetical protein